MDVLNSTARQWSTAAARTAHHLESTGLTQDWGQLYGYHRDFQSNCCVNLLILGQPCEFYLWGSVALSLRTTILLSAHPDFIPELIPGVDQQSCNTVGGCAEVDEGCCAWPRIGIFSKPASQPDSNTRFLLPVSADPSSVQDATSYYAFPINWT